MSTLHPVLLRQMRRAGIDDTDGALTDLMLRVSRSYNDADQERYTMERSLSIVSDEMQALYENLRMRTDAIHEATLEASVDGVLIVDDRGRLLSFNGAFVKIWRIDPALVATRDFAAVRQAAMRVVADPEAVSARMKELYAAPHARARDELRLADGRVLERDTGPVIDEHGAVLGRVWFFRDVTELKRHEAVLRAARDDAEAASRAKSAFLANMSHELRTPLNSILGFGRLLQRAPLAADQRAQFDFIVKAGEHMLALVNDLLDLRRVEDGGRLEDEIVNVQEAVAEATALVHPLPAARGQEVTARVAPELAVRGDRRAVVQILVNLLSNAAKFTQAGGHIAIDARRAGARVELAVSDDGIGIAAAGLEKLFSYYAQLDGKSDHGLKGSGIGLALTRALVHRLGGEIGVQSTPGQGSTFRVALVAT